MQKIRCGKCPACLRVETAKSACLKVANPPFSHADDSTVMLWNDTLDNNPCETWATCPKCGESILLSTSEKHKTMFNCGSFSTKVHPGLVESGRCKDNQIIQAESYSEDLETTINFCKEIAKIIINIVGNSDKQNSQASFDDIRDYAHQIISK